MSYGINPDPGVDEVYQYPDMHQPLSGVCIVGQPEVKTLPARRSVLQFFPISTFISGNQLQKIVEADARIRRVYLGTSANTVVVGTQEILSASGASGSAPAGIPAGWTAGWEGFHEPLYAYATGGTPTLWVRVEYWAD